MEKAKVKTKKSKPQFKSQNLGFYIAILIFAFYIFNFIGCATVKETAKGIAGVSTKVLEDARKDAVIKKFNYDYNTCYNKVEGILTQIGAYIYAKDNKKQMIAIYVSEADTTPVGLFLKAIDANNTQIEVSSPSTYAKEFIAKSVFLALEKSLKPQD